MKTIMDIKNHFSVKEVKFLSEGFRSKAYLLDKENILLSGVNEKSFETYKSDKKILDFLNDRIKSVKIPKDVKLIKPGEKGLRYGGEIYRCIEGDVFDIENVESYDLEKIGMDISHFLNELHSIDIDDFDSTFNKRDYIKREKDLVNRNIELMGESFNSKQLKRLDEWKEEYFKMLDNTTKFSIIHGDFWYENYILSKKDFRLIGVIDFENTRIADPIMDLTPLLYVSDSFLEYVLDSYKFTDGDTRKRIKILGERREIVSFEYIKNYCNKLEQDEQIEKIRKLYQH